MPHCSSAATVRISLLGDCRIVVGTATLGLDARKTRELLAYLVVNRRHPQHRDSVARALWPHCRDHRRYLRQSVWQLQKALRPIELATGSSALRTEGDDWLIVDLPETTTIDVDRLRDAARRAEQAAEVG